MINESRLRGLAESEGFPRISIFMPTHKGGPELRQDPILFKNLLRDAAAALEQRGLSERDIDTLFADARRFIDDESFWPPIDSLALFISEEGTDVNSVPLELEPGAHVSDRFVIKPLLELFSRDGRFHVLAASQDGVRLYRAHRFAMEEIHDERLQRTAAEFLNRTEFENALRYHATGRGAETILYHGQDPQDEQREQIEQFVRRIASAVDKILAGDTAPLVLAADEFLLGLLRRHIGHGGLMEAAISEHPTSMDEKTLHSRAYDLVEARLDQGRRTAMERFRMRMGEGDDTASDDAETIASAAADGRVETLFVAAGRRPSAGEVPAAANQAGTGTATGDAEPEDLVETAIRETLLRGGIVFSQPDGIGSFPEIAAIFRY